VPPESQALNPERVDSVFDHITLGGTPVREGKTCDGVEFARSDE
jgi:hypothetical protein